MSCNNLPQELIMAIVDNIWYDKRSLKTFSLVCKAWTNPAREHLFGSLTIHDDHLEEMKSANITVTSTCAPFLRVRNLRLSSCSYRDEFWRDLIPLFARIKTPRLQSLEVKDMKWPSLSPEEQSSFLCRFESIVSLRLSLFRQDTSHDIPKIICSFPRLRNLILRPNYHRCETPGPFPLSPELCLPEQLSTLRIVSVTSDHRFVLEWLCSIPEQLSIQNLHICLTYYDPEDIDLVNMFLRALGSSLEVFGCPLEESFSVDLTYNNHLRGIHFYVMGFDIFPEHIKVVLSRIRSRQLEQVAFHLPDGFWRILGEIFHKIEQTKLDAEWNKVDAILASPQFATIKDVHISPCPPRVSSLSVWLATLLPTCHARGIISFGDHPSW